jgi:hypothetical protein
MLKVEILLQKVDTLTLKVLTIHQVVWHRMLKECFVLPEDNVVMLNAVTLVHSVIIHIPKVIILQPPDKHLMLKVEILNLMEIIHMLKDSIHMLMDGVLIHVVLNHTL